MLLSQLVVSVDLCGLLEPIKIYLQFWEKSVFDEHRFGS
jgi:hypothetical protein